MNQLLDRTNSLTALPLKSGTYVSRLTLPSLWLRWPLILRPIHNDGFNNLRDLWRMSPPTRRLLMQPLPPPRMPFAPVLTVWFWRCLLASTRLLPMPTLPMIRRHRGPHPPVTHALLRSATFGRTAPTIPMQRMHPATNPYHQTIHLPQPGTWLPFSFHHATLGAPYVFHHPRPCSSYPCLACGLPLGRRPGLGY